RCNRQKVGSARKPHGRGQQHAADFRATSRKFVVRLDALVAYIVDAFPSVQQAKLAVGDENVTFLLPPDLLEHFEHFVLGFEVIVVLKPPAVERVARILERLRHPHHRSPRITPEETPPDERELALRSWQKFGQPGPN